ncbi:hypothetical protein, variant [Verruconis gallopava]|uniref:DUF3824 domain-containing protein n=1 Tax=Verruconis gallopava TaxID=253628 RepID=A0A0D1XV71_9PEZI|nr:hypothetical protein, variant [Verruconis gallopava]KIW06696.1 hypothetical protein, variant [Verruconis gallopava]
MSEYDYESRRGSDRTRYREPEYVSETTFVHRGSGRPSQDLVYREDSIEDIPRDFPPTAEYRRTRIRDEYPPRRSRGSRYDDDDDYYSDYGASGGAGYARSRRGPPRRRSEYYDDDYYSDDYGRPRHERRKSTIEKTLEDLGIGGAVGALLGRSRSKSRGRHERDSDYGDYDSRRGPRSKSRETRKKWQQAAKAAVLTGVIEAVRSRNEPGGWTGAKGQRIATAALGAAGVDGLLDKDPNKHAKRHIIESVVGGLAANRLANGPRSRSGSRGRSRSRSRSVGGGLRERSRSLFRSLSRGRGRSRSASYDSYGSPERRPRSKSRGLKELVAAGGIAAAGKAIYDRVRSKSRGRARSASVSSQESYVPARRQRYGADRGPFPPDSRDPSRGPPPLPMEGKGAATRGGELEKIRGHNSSSESISTTDMEKKRKKMRGPYGPSPISYADGNPYAGASNLPPPPMGAAPYR